MPAIVGSLDSQGYIVKILQNSLNKDHITFTLPAIPGIIAALKGYDKYCTITLPYTKLSLTRGDLATINAMTQEVIVTVVEPLKFLGILKSNIFIDDYVLDFLPFTKSALI
jgi:hypothetical protein